MAKLYAELISDKGGRVTGKGGNDGIMIHLSKGNKKKYTITLESDQLVIYKDDGPLFHDWIE